IFNDPATRLALQARGIRIPEDTLFVAAQHDTVTDEVTVLEPWRIPATHESAMWELLRALDAAREGNVRERAGELPGPVDPALAVADTVRRSVDWAEAYPEWGLAGNAAFIVGPRAITRGRDLGRRAFLHS
ncbi:putative inorganic carbon transporter subunit DabA, partial [Pseudomonas aeruginosa]|uniref:putative inorganic carbon transporter subunit DabA n=1 Tax=Pseudomonas aeruginosa TaxID=287 RepID=UPI002B40A596